MHRNYTVTIWYVISVYFCGRARVVDSSISIGSIMMLTLYVLNFADGTKPIFTFYVIHPHWHDTSSLDTSSSKVRIYLFYMVNIKGVDDLVTQGARASETMILTQINRDNSVPTHIESTRLSWYIRWIERKCPNSNQAPANSKNFAS